MSGRPAGLALACLAAALLVGAPSGAQPRGGSVRGAVTFVGAVPTLASLPAQEGSHAGHGGCGASVPDESLRVDPTSRGVANAVLWLEGVAEPASSAPASASAPVAVEQQGCVFAPHVLAVRVGAPVRFGNRDAGVLHNVHAYLGLEGDETAFNLATPAGLAATRAFARPGLHRVVCDAGHAWMRLYAHAFAHRFFAVTDARGRFAIEGVPPGAYQLVAWHEGFERRGVDAQGRPAYSAPLQVARAVTVRAAGLTVALTLDASPALRFAR